MKKLSSAATARLFRYYSYFSSLLQKGEQRVSSEKIANHLGLTPSQIRQDLGALGCTGHQGYGYNLDRLCAEIESAAGLNAHRRTLLIGAGSLGRALAAVLDFDKAGFHLIAVFDKKESLVGQIVKGMPVRHISGLDEYCRENLPKAAILCLPQSEAAAVARQLYGLGIEGIWNLSGCELPKAEGVTVESLDISHSLMKLSLRTNEKNN